MKDRRTELERQIRCRKATAQTDLDYIASLESELAALKEDPQWEIIGTGLSVCCRDALSITLRFDGGMGGNYTLGIGELTKAARHAGLRIAEEGGMCISKACVGGLKECLLHGDVPRASYKDGYELGRSGLAREVLASMGEA